MTAFRATRALASQTEQADENLLQYLSPLGWEHSYPTGDFVWRSSTRLGQWKFRPLRPMTSA
ncbi:MAG: hypothetical protein H7203_10400 [Rhizobacter sp.]|nr:hypothetical protein [Burkholderiales bacterium]